MIRPITPPPRLAALVLASLLSLVGPVSAQPVEVTRAPPPYPTALLKKADAALTNKDFSVARSWYELAFRQGAAGAATSLGKTYDPNQMGSLGAVSLLPDPEAAARWYEKAILLGDTAATPLLLQLKARTSP